MGLRSTWSWNSSAGKAVFVCVQMSRDVACSQAQQGVCGTVGCEAWYWVSGVMTP